MLNVRVLVLISLVAFFGTTLDVVAQWAPPAEEKWMGRVIYQVCGQALLADVNHVSPGRLIPGILIASLASSQVLTDRQHCGSQLNGNRPPCRDFNRVCLIKKLLFG